ncbi:MAG: O-antigen ligase family protein, partial [Vicinamibacteria bacterium]
MTVDARSWTLPPARGGFLSGESTVVYGIAFWLALVQISIAASQIVLALLVLLWLYLVAREEASFVSLPFDAPFGLYAGLTFGAAAFSFDPGASFPASKEILLLVVPYVLVSAVRRLSTLEQLVVVLVGVADVGALLGLWQYAFGDLSDINHRIRGFLGHYMTYSGLLMGVGILAFAGFLFAEAQSRFRWFLLGSFLLIQAALILTLTRSAWIGTAVAVVLLLLVKNWKLLVLVPVMAVGVSALLPRDVERRVLSLVSPDVSGWDRVYMLRAGSRIVRNHPLLGV